MKILNFYNSYIFRFCKELDIFVKLNLYIRRYFPLKRNKISYVLSIPQDTAFWLVTLTFENVPNQRVDEKPNCWLGCRDTCFNEHAVSSRSTAKLDGIEAASKNDDLVNESRCRGGTQLPLPCQFAFIARMYAVI